MGAGQKGSKQNSGKAVDEDNKAMEGKLSKPGDLRFKSKNSKKVRKNMREILDLGEKVNNFIYPAEFFQLVFGRPSSGFVSFS